VVHLWRNQGPEQRSAVSQEIDSTRESVLVARLSGDDEAENVLAAQWRRRFSALVNRAPRAGAELEAVLNDDLRPLLPSPDQEQVFTVTQTIHAGRDAYVSGRDMTIFRGQTINER